MKTALVALLLMLALPGMAAARGVHRVRPHVNRDGEYVKGHAATNADGTRLDNWSTQGNVNPLTGKAGTKPRYGRSRNK